MHSGIPVPNILKEPVPTQHLTPLIDLEQNTYKQCPVCNFPLMADSAVCERCGNDILEDISSLDQQSMEAHTRSIESKKAAWYARRLTDKLDAFNTSPAPATSHQGNGDAEMPAPSILATATRAELLQEVSLRRNWWAALNHEWQEVIKATLKIVRNPGDTELADFFSTTHLRCDNRRIHDLMPARVLEDLQQLRCDESPIETIDAIAGLRKLQRLYAFDCDFDSIEAVRNLRNLKLLWISSTKITSLDPVRNLENLEELYCSETAVSDLSPLAGLKNLEKLSCYKTAISSIDALAGLENLTELGINHSTVSDLYALAGLKNMEYLRCNRTMIEDIEPLRNLLFLRELSIAGTKVADLAPLAMLLELEELDITNTPIRSLEPIMEHQHLEKVEMTAGLVPDSEITQFIELHPDCELIIKS